MSGSLPGLVVVSIIYLTIIGGILWLLFYVIKKVITESSEKIAHIKTFNNEKVIEKIDELYKSVESLTNRNTDRIIERTTIKYFSREQAKKITSMAITCASSYVIKELRLNVLIIFTSEVEQRNKIINQILRTAVELIENNISGFTVKSGNLFNTLSGGIDVLIYQHFFEEILNAMESVKNIEAPDVKAKNFYEILEFGFAEKKHFFEKMEFGTDI